MSADAVFRAVYPIGDTQVMSLPVLELGPAIGYYTRVLGFTLVSKTETGAELQRNEVTIGLVKSDADPQQASCYFEVLGIGALHEEYAAAGIEPTGIRPTEFDRRAQKIFFAKEPYGVCFCFGETAPKV